MEQHVDIQSNILHIRADIFTSSLLHLPMGNSDNKDPQCPVHICSDQELLLMHFTTQLEQQQTLREYLDIQLEQQQYVILKEYLDIQPQQ